MHQTKKGNEWKFGMKMHIGVDETLGLVHSVAMTAANVHDLTPADQLLHGEEKRVFTDASYQGIHKREEHKSQNVDWYVAMRPGKRKMLEKDSPEARKQTLQASIRAKVEHPFKVIKQVFGYSKVRYRGLLKNTERLMILAGFANLLRVQKALLV
jgi:transposase, IS5 family